jgi:FkbM family methyltransferase
MAPCEKILSAVCSNWWLNAAGLVLSFCGSVVLIRAVPPRRYIGLPTVVFEAVFNSGLTRHMAAAQANANDEIYACELNQLTSELGLEDSVAFAGPAPRGGLPEHYRRCAVHVNLTLAGFGDKVGSGAMSCGRTCLVANDDFRETLGAHAGELLSLEPNTRTFRVLDRNVRANPDLRWKAFPLALWKTAGPLGFGATDYSTASRVYELAPSGRRETVDAIALSAFVDAHRLKKITLLKIDIEGAEEAMLDRVEYLALEIHSGRVDETVVMRAVRAHLPHVHRFTRHDTNKPLILASRSADAGRHVFPTS